MLRKMIIAAAFGLATIGAAAAQSGSSGGTTATDAETGAQAAPGVLDDPVMMKPFYTDDTMQTLRPSTEFGAAVKALNTNDRDKIAKQCEQSTTQKGTFCQAFNEANKT